MPEVDSEFLLPDHQIPRLVLAKKLFQHGVEHAKTTAPLDHLIAVHNIHNAIEIVLKAICDNHGIVRDQGLSFPEIIKLIDRHEVFKAKGLKVPLRPKLLSINTQRNQAQHEGLPPSPEALEESRILGEQILKDLFSNYLKIDFGQLSIVSMVACAHFQNLLRLAETAIHENNYRISLLRSHVVFNWAEDCVNSALQRDFHDFPPRFGGPAIYMDGPKPTSDIRLIGEMLDRLAKYFEDKLSKFERELSPLLTGIGIGDYRKLMGCRPNFGFLANGDLVSYQLDDLRESKDNAQWAHDFIIDTIIKWQSQGFKLSMNSIYEPAYNKLCSNDIR